MSGFPHRHLLGIEPLEPSDILTILDTAETLREVLNRPIKKVPTLRGKLVVSIAAGMPTAVMGGSSRSAGAAVARISSVLWRSIAGIVGMGRMLRLGMARLARITGMGRRLRMAGLRHDRSPVIRGLA
jgi:hypothetical protein